MSGSWNPGPGATSGDDTFVATVLGALADALGGNDVLYGGAGNDTLIGNTGDDTVFAGDGNDSVVGGDGADVLYGEAGNDRIDGGIGDDSLYGGVGNDTIQGGDGNDTIRGGDGADSLDGGAGQDIVSYDDASSAVFVSIQGAQNVSVGGAAAGDTLVNFEGFIGSNFNDTLLSPNGGFALFGLGGNDLILAGQQSDTVVGGEGEDTIFSGNSNDSVAGGLFNPITGDAGDDLERDFLLGGQGSDTVWLGQSDVGVGGQGNGDLALLPEGYTDSGQDSIVTYPVPGGGTDTLSFDIWTSTVPGSAPIYLNSFESVSFYQSVIPCFATGTMIATARGEVAVEDLRVGDLVLTAQGGAPLQPVVWLGHSKVDLARHPNRRAIAPVVIRAGALGKGMPHRHLRVSPDHGIFVDGYLVPAGRLVNGTTIVQEMWRPAVTYWHVELPAHGLVVSEGAVSESYLDDGNRKHFDNYAITTLFKDFASERANGRYKAQACRPVLEEGEALDRIRARLWSIADSARTRSLTA